MCNVLQEARLKVSAADKLKRVLYMSYYYKKKLFIEPHLAKKRIFDLLSKRLRFGKQNK